MFCALVRDNWHTNSVVRFRGNPRVQQSAEGVCNTDTAHGVPPNDSDCGNVYIRYDHGAEYGVETDAIGGC